MACAVGRGLPDGTARAGQCDHEFGRRGERPCMGSTGRPTRSAVAVDHLLHGYLRKAQCSSPPGDGRGAYEEVSDWTQQKVTDWRETHENCVPPCGMSARDDRTRQAAGGRARTSRNTARLDHVQGRPRRHTISVLPAPARTRS